MKKILRLTALLSLFTAALFVSCTNVDVKTDVAKNHNFVMTFATADVAADATVIQNMRLFTFYKGTSSDHRFRKEVFGITRQDNVLSANVETGDWHLAALSLLTEPVGTTIIPPSPTIPMEDAPMYKYAPAVSPITNQSYDAAEIFFTNIPLPRSIVASPAVNLPVDVTIARNVAMVELVISKSTATFNTNGTHHIKLYSVPSTISYTGALLPNKDKPDTLSLPLQARLQLKKHEKEEGYLQSDTVRFIIPAHKGVDPTTLKMLVSVDLERISGGSRFTKTKEIPIVAECNQILRVSITVDDGIEFGTDIVPWNKLTFDETVGEKYSNWLYVKKDSKGNGQSWRDALPTITAAVEKIDKIRNAGYTVHGILVAGGSGVDKLYTEGINVPAGTRIFGGWEGKSGTELAANDDKAPYTSKDRNLAKYKAYLSLGTAGVLLDGAGSVLDGFCITDVSASTLVPVVKVSHSGAWLNAVEMLNLSVNTVDILQMTAGTATNILVSDCSKGVSLTGATTKLINATITNNVGKLTCTGQATLQNSVVWWGDLATGGGYDFSNGTVQYCAIQGDNESNKLPTGTGYSNNVPVNMTNKAWFTTGTNGNIPGPNFDAGDNPLRPYYSAAGNRTPMIARGDNDAFNNNTGAMPTGYKKDINGNPRTYTHNGEVRTDIGCYQESSGTLGFKLRWASERIYVSSKNGYITDVPLLLPDENKITQIGLDWEVSLKDNTLKYCILEPVLPTWPVKGKTTAGEYVLAGHFLLKTLPETTGPAPGNTGAIRDVYNNYVGNAERFCGTVTIHTSLGDYLPDVNIDIYQTPGQPSVWEAGYVGSFHRNDETKERYIHGPNTGAWTVRITSGLDWIKIDGKGKDYNYGEVEDTFGGVVEGTGNIKFRVGMKSKYTPTTDKPARYGLITIERSGGIAMFFVRQGEEADYLYRPTDERTAAPTGRNDARKFSPFSLCDPDHGTAASKNLGPRGGGFVDYPSQIGYFFQKNQTTAYLRGAQTANLPSISNTTWSDTREVCPEGYRHATYSEWIQSLYRNTAVPTGNSAMTGQTGDEAKANFVWGRYADGYYDQIAPDPVAAATEFLPVGPTAAQRPYVASRGILMVNHYNYASLFFPTAGTMMYGTGTTIISNDVGQLYTEGTVSSNTVMIPSSYHTGTAKTIYGNTHWMTGHIGMTCTIIGGGTNATAAVALSTATQVRCVKE